MAQKIKKGDEVQILAGKDKGERGEVLKVFPKEHKVLVRGINNVKRHSRATPQQEGGIITKEMPLHISNVALIDPSDDRPVRVGFKVNDDGIKQRISRRTGEVIDQA